MEKYQQGDVVMFKVDDDYFKNNTRNSGDNHVSYKGNQPTHAIIAFGEVTGHKHQVNMEDMLEDAGVTLCKDSQYDRQNRGVIVTGAPVQLKHEEHDTITLEPGFYLQRIVKEYDHISGIARRVAA